MGHDKKKKKGPNERTDQSSRKNTTKPRTDSQPIRCTVQNTGNQEAHRIGEFGHKLDEKMKAMLRETKENVQGNNSDGKETGTQINGVIQKEERKIQPEKNEATRIQKNEERLRNLQDILKCSNIRIIGVPKGEEEEQKTENLFEQIMKENFPSLAKEIDFKEVQEAQRVPKKLDPRRNTPRHIIITLPKIKRKDLHPRLLYPAKLTFRMEGKIKCFLDKVKLKKFIITKPLLYEMLKGVT